jgi:molybdopterin molybdotransferase
MKPGAPVMAAVYKHTLLLCLSGNPYGAAVGFELLARPVIARLAQNPKWNLKKKRAVMQDDYEKKAGCRRFLRGVLTGDQVSLTVGNQSSGACYASKGSNCLIEISPDMPGARKGTYVWVYLL